MIALMIRTSSFPVCVLGRKPGTHVFRPRTPEHPEDETFPGLLLLRPSGLDAAPAAARGPGTVREAARYVRGRPEVLWTIFLVGVVGTFGLNFPIVLTAMTAITPNRKTGQRASSSPAMDRGTIRAIMQPMIPCAMRNAALGTRALAPAALMAMPANIGPSSSAAGR